jgi:hypothetical protein
MNFDLLLQDALGPFRISLEGNYFSTDGYDVVKNHSTFNPRLELLATPEASFFVSVFYYYEERGNGTPLQFNHTGTGGGAIGGRLGTPDNGELRFAAYARRKRLTSPEPSTRLGATWLRVEFGAEPLRLS